MPVVSQRKMTAVTRQWSALGPRAQSLLRLVKHSGGPSDVDAFFGTAEIRRRHSETSLQSDDRPLLVVASGVEYLLTCTASWGHLSGPVQHDSTCLGYPAVQVPNRSDGRTGAL